MDGFLFLLLLCAIAYLWQRVTKLENALRDGEFNFAPPPPKTLARDPVPATPPKPAERSVAREEARRAKPFVEPQPAHEIAADRAPDIQAVREDEYTETEVPEESPTKNRFQFDFEHIFGRLLPIWAGGITLAIAGFFMVRYSIDEGLLTPEVRVTLSLLFGGLLVAGAEAAFRFEKTLADPRVRQALSGAGLATLYAGFYLGGSQYGLFGPALAFVGLASVTAMAIALSFRFGLPSAVLGLVGGFAAPLLVGGQEANVPLLAIYLALVTAGLTFTGRHQHRSWLALAALAGGLGWGVLLLLSNLTGSGAIVALGGYFVLLGAVLPVFAGGREGPRWMRLGAAGIASLQLAALISQAGHSLLAWSLYLLIGGALAFFAWREPLMRAASALAAVVGLGILSLWDAPEPGAYALVIAGLAGVFGCVPLAHIWRDRATLVDAAQVAGFALLASAVTVLQFALTDVQPLLALAVFAFAFLPGLGAWLTWCVGDTPLSRDSLLMVGATAIATFIAGLVATPVWAAPLVGSALTLGLLWLGRGRTDRRLVWFAWAGAVTTLLAMLASLRLEHEIEALVRGANDGIELRSVLRWAAALLPFIALTMRETGQILRRIAQCSAAGLLYGAAAQILPSEALAWFAALVCIALMIVRPQWRTGQITLYAVAFVWSLSRFIPWLAEGAEALVGTPMLVDLATPFQDIALYLAPVVAIAIVSAWRGWSEMSALTKGMIGLAGAVALCAFHIAFKQVFGIKTVEQFAAIGVVERLTWQALLLIAAGMIWRFANSQPWAKPLVAGLLAATLVHFTIFSLGWHNPLWDKQYVGGLPIANWLIPAYATGAVALIAIRKSKSDRLARLRPMVDYAIMIIVSLFAFSELRQFYAGALLVGDAIGETEDVLRSVLGIALAAGFLLWGSYRGERSWRIGSLVLMLLAVLKVFFVDISGLEGLARIASFMALGFSLIGIGWFYSRQLKSGPAKGDRVAAN